MSPRIGLDTKTLIQAAAEIADSQGLDALTLAALANKLNIRTPSLYNHIDGLPGLRRKMAAYGLERLHHNMLQSIADKSGDDAIHALSYAYIGFARMHPGVYESTLRTPDPEDPELQRAGKTVLELVMGVLNAYNLDEETALHAVRGLRSILHGFASLEKFGGFGMPLDLDVSFRIMVDTYLAGIRRLSVKREEA